LARRHRDPVLFERRLQVAHLLAELLNLGIPAGEFLFQLRLCALRRRRFAKQPFAVDEADLEIGALGEAGSGKGGREERSRGTNEQLLHAMFQLSLLRKSCGAHRIPSRDEGPADLQSTLAPH
jgi:hypothetical protein